MLDIPPRDGNHLQASCNQRHRLQVLIPFIQRCFFLVYLYGFLDVSHTRLIINYTHVGPGGFFSGGTEKSCPVKIHPPKVAHQCNASLSNKIRPTRSPWRTVKLLWGAWLDGSKLCMSQIFWDSVGRICPNFNDSTVLQLSKVGVEMEMIEKGSRSFWRLTTLQVPFAEKLLAPDSNLVKLVPRLEHQKNILTNDCLMLEVDGYCFRHIFKIL